MGAWIPRSIKPGGFGNRLVRRLKREGRIAGGLFAGMHYVGESVCGFNAPKLLGVYEIELRPVFEQLLRTPFGEIVDVGAAEGYYAVGCALKWPNAKVVAFETTAEGRALLEEVASANGVRGRLEIRGHCTVGDLQAVTSHESIRLLIMDVEGAEEDLLDAKRVPALRQCHIVVELHDWVDAGMADRIRVEFSGTHLIQEIRSRPRQFEDYESPSFPLLRRYMFRSLLAYSHERPVPMRWFYMRPRTSIAQ